MKDSFLENNFKVYTINALYSKMYKRNLRKTKTDKLDCLSLSELYFTNNFKQYIRPDNIYLNMNALARQYFALDQLCANLKNRYKNLVYLCFPEYELLFKKKLFIVILPYLLLQIIHTLKSSPTLELIIYNITLKIIIISVGNRNQCL